MFENEIAINKYLRSYLLSVATDLSEADLATSPAEHVNPPLRIIAHLCVIGDLGLKRLSQQATCPAEWAAAYGPGTPSTSHPAKPPTKIEALRQIDKTYDAFCAAVAVATPDFLGQPNNVPLFSGSSIKTTGNLLSHLLTSHFATHLGQLSLQRRLRGLPPLF